MFGDFFDMLAMYDTLVKCGWGALFVASLLLLAYVMFER